VSTDTRYPYFRDYTLDMTSLSSKVVFPCHEYSGFSVEFKQGGGGLISVAQTNDDPQQILNPQWFSITGYDPTLDSSFTTLSSPALVDFPAVGAWAKVQVTSVGTTEAIVRVFLKSTRAVSATSLIPGANAYPVALHDTINNTPALWFTDGNENSILAVGLMDLENGTVYNQLNPLPVETIPDYKTIRLDEGATYTYIGKADPGSSTASALWQIQRMTNADNTILFANGNANFNNIWNNRGSLTYT